MLHRGDPIKPRIRDSTCIAACRSSASCSA
jgi:hypothetical protein